MNALPLNVKIKAMEARQRDIERLLAMMPTATQPCRHPNLAEVYRAKVTDLRTTLEALGERHEAMDLIRGWIDELRPIPEDAVLQFELHGELAEILALCEVAPTASEILKTTD